MFAYRHGFHAGNKADVFKHSVLTAVLMRFRAKEKPFLYFDSHAGAGFYKLDSEWSIQTGEAAGGIGVLLGSSAPGSSAGSAEGTESLPPVPPAVEAYKKLCMRFYGKGFYPGSPEIAASLSRPGDSLVLCELHPSEIAVLRQNMKGVNSRDFPPDFPCGTGSSGRGNIHIHYRDGFEAVTGLLPPGGSLPKRGFVLMDPSYELPSDYKNVSEVVPRAVSKWNTGIFIVWYPLVGRRMKQVEKMKKSLSDSLSACFSGIRSPSVNSGEREEPFFFSELEFAGKDDGGMYGCGLLVVRPQWNFAGEVREINGYLRSVFSRRF